MCLILSNIEINWAPHYLLQVLSILPHYTHKRRFIAAIPEGPFAPFLYTLSFFGQRWHLLDRRWKAVTAISSLSHSFKSKWTFQTIKKDTHCGQKIFLHLELNIQTYNQINKVKTKRVLVLSKPRIFGLQFIWYTEFAESLLI